jgi:hypothetical protein
MAYMAKRIIIHIIPLIAIIILTLFFWSINNFAQSAVSLQKIEISPPSQEFDIDPGKELNFEVKVRNVGNNKYYMNARVEDFTASGEEGQVALIEQGPYAISSWSIIEPKEFELEPGKTQIVKIRSDVPEQNIGGGRYGAVVFAVSGTKTANATAVAQEIASLFLLRVSGPIEENLSILNLQAPQFAEFGPIPIKVKVFNSGNIHVKTAGLVTVNNVLGNKVADIVIPPTNVFPQSNRILEANFNENFLIGPYQAQALLFYGENNQSLVAFVPFFVFPVRFVAGLIGFVILIAFIIKLYAKRKSTQK